jgi:hypothetical protein
MMWPMRLMALGHGLVDRVMLQVLDESAVDLEIVDRQVLEVSERARAAAEIVEREQEPHRLALANEFGGLAQVVDRRGLGDLEADRARGQCVSEGLFANEIEKALRIEGHARQVDGAR